jgi:hypothetical protein
LATAIEWDHPLPEETHFGIFSEEIRMAFWNGNSIFYFVLILLAAAGLSFLWSGVHAMSHPPDGSLIRRIFRIVISRIQFVIGATTLIWVAMMMLRLIFQR